MRYLNPASILYLHENLKKRFPVTEGKTNLGKIDLFLEKPTLMLYGTQEKYDTIYKKAGCILEGFCRGHAFTDGNKRTALLATYTFLQLNDHFWVVPLNTVEFLVKVAQKEAKTEAEIDVLIYEIADWLEKRTATNGKEYNKLTKKYITYPLIKLFLVSLTGVGMLYASYMLNKWFATDMHPEYKQDMRGIMRFLLSAVDESRNAIKKFEEKK